MNVSFDRLGLVGRFGNAAFQLASTAGIAHTLGVEPRYNASWLHRDFFSVPPELFADDFVDCVPAERTHLVRHLDERAAVYLQDLSLFSEILPKLREWLRPSPVAEEIMAEHHQMAEFQALRRPVLSVHVRRGDNAPGGDPGTPNKHLWHPMPSLNFYRTAMERFDPPAGADVVSGSTVVFSDDIAWCRKMLPGADLYFEGMSRPKEHEPDFLTAPVRDFVDWFCQVDCDFHVCSNSTFGVMAAIIAGDDNAIVPWPFFGPKLKYVDASLMFPSTWTRLSAQGD